MCGIYHMKNLAINDYRLPLQFRNEDEEEEEKDRKKTLQNEKENARTHALTQLQIVLSSRQMRPI